MVFMVLELKETLSYAYVKGNCGQGCCCTGISLVDYCSLQYNEEENERQPLEVVEDK